MLARSHADAPEIDGSVLVKGDARVGEFAMVRITGASEYDLTGELMPNFESHDEDSRATTARSP